ncbi:hypothetical protein BDP55DRAFT_730285 [Colletotrichum godetiae]|uniref:Uncharacterized protein n=1 Tax=Colletotrichum godetiae TaxID=1209918 RepID=A0AAJ0AK01_9PEZI|nr:uncharacterized protein BDP55DRAFT_730285 [Colletotrichum godetiae]KAK1673802.1 hypothetical protein BDP55DRAFT_730285 [Colletotrichum godetiae]
MAAACKACEDPLIITIDPDSEDEDNQTGDEPQNVPDDLELPCGCHFHWQCLLDQSEQTALSLSCPSCATYLPSQNPTTGEPAILTRYVNEGGLQDALDILPTLTEEAYLASNPEARPARAYHLMAAEGDLEGIVALLHDANEELAGNVDSLGQLIRYQDPLAGGRSALHVAVERAQEEVVWLLLWIASRLSTDAFPAAAREVAESLQIVRLTNDVGEDIRALKAEDGTTAEDVAKGLPARWGALVDAGVLRA